MALGDILEAIRVESRETASEILAAAEVEASRILERAREEAAGEEERLAASRDDHARLESSRIESRAHLDAARERRAVRERVYQSALEEAALRIEVLRASSEYEEVLAQLLDEAVAVLPIATTVRVDPTDEELIKGILATREYSLGVETHECEWGGILVSADGRAVHNDLRSRLDRADEHLRHIAGDLIPALRGGV